MTEWTMWDTLAMLVGYAIVFYSGMRYAENKMIRRMMDLLTDEEVEEMYKLQTQLEQLDPKDEARADAMIDDAMRKLKFEIIDEHIENGSHYFYTHKGEFLCQGTSRQEAVQNFLAKNKKDCCIITPEKQKLYVIDGVIKESL
jgi:hypothetical protein